MMLNPTRAAFLAVVLAMPVAMHAQRGGGGGRVGGNPVAPLIDMRRELNLSARQLVQLDSIERTLLQRNQGLRDRMRTRLDSMRPRTRGSSEAEIQQFRAEGDSLRALRQVMVRNDSVARAAAMSVLTDSQRVRVRERAAERRGFEAGRRSTMRGGARGGFRGRQGMDGPRFRQGRPGERMGMGMGMGPRGGGRGGPGMRPFDDRLPDDSMRPMRRFRGDAPVEPLRPQDEVAPRRRLRRPPADSI